MLQAGVRAHVAIRFVTPEAGLAIPAGRAGLAFTPEILAGSGSGVITKEAGLAITTLRAYIAFSTRLVEIGQDSAFAVASAID